MTSKMKHNDSSFCNEWDLTHLSHAEYASLFMLRLCRLSAQNAPSAQVNVSLNEPLLWMCSSCNNVQKLKINSIYYNSVLIVMLCI